jgi:hypothetical protein
MRLTETSLRATLDKMQVSLINHNGEHAYIRSAPGPQESSLQKAIGVRPLLPLINERELSI